MLLNRLGDLIEMREATHLLLSENSLIQVKQELELHFNRTIEEEDLPLFVENHLNIILVKKEDCEEAYKLLKAI